MLPVLKALWCGRKNTDHWVIWLGLQFPPLLLLTKRPDPWDTQKRDFRSTFHTWNRSKVTSPNCNVLPITDFFLIHISCCGKFTIFRSSQENDKAIDKPDTFKDKIVVKRLAVLKSDTNGYQKVITGQENCPSVLNKEISDSQRLHCSSECSVYIYLAGREQQGWEQGEKTNMWLSCLWKQEFCFGS